MEDIILNISSCKEITAGQSDSRSVEDTAGHEHTSINAVKFWFFSQFKFGYGVSLAVQKDADLGGFQISHNALSLLINQLEKVLPGQVNGVLPATEVMGFHTKTCPH